MEFVVKVQMERFEFARGGLYSLDYHVVELGGIHECYVIDYIYMIDKPLVAVNARRRS